MPLVSGEFKFYWASSTSDEWYNQLVIHTEPENEAAAAISVLSINCLETCISRGVFECLHSIFYFIHSHLSVIDLCNLITSL